ncbi:unnamed protein product, partial [Prorocentrum cordatum]
GAPGPPPPPIGPGGGHMSAAGAAQREPRGEVRPPAALPGRALAERLHAEAEARRQRRGEEEEAQRRAVALAAQGPKASARSMELLRGRPVSFEERAREYAASREQMLQRKLQERRAREREEAPGRPAISERAQRVQRMADDWDNWERRRQQRIHQGVVQRVAEEQRECTFRPHGEASWRACSHTKQCSKNLVWFPRNVLRTFLVEAVLFEHIGLMF